MASKPSVSTRDDRRRIVWTDELDEMMIALLGQKLSTAEVARRLGPAFTKDSVIGRIHRLEKTLGRRIDRNGIDVNGVDRAWTKGLRAIREMRAAGEQTRVVKRAAPRIARRAVPDVVPDVVDDAERPVERADRVVGIDGGETAAEREEGPENGPDVTWTGPADVRLKTPLLGRFTDRDGRPWSGWTKRRNRKVMGVSYAGIGRCQFIMNSGKPALFCGDLVKGNGAWCAVHYDVVYKENKS